MTSTTYDNNNNNIMYTWTSDQCLVYAGSSPWSPKIRSGSNCLDVPDWNAAVWSCRKYVIVASWWVASRFILAMPPLVSLAVVSPSPCKALFRSPALQDGIIRTMYVYAWEDWFFARICCLDWLGFQHCSLLFLEVINAFAWSFCDVPSWRYLCQP